jgi:hypothetical protein
MLVQYYYKFVKYKLNKFEAFINTYIERTSLDLSEAGGRDTLPHIDKHMTYISIKGRAGRATLCFERVFSASYLGPTYPT